MSGRLDCVSWSSGRGPGSEVRGARSWLSWTQGRHQHLERTSCPPSLAGHCWQLSPADRTHKQVTGRETGRMATPVGQTLDTLREEAPTEIQLQLRRCPARAQSTARVRSANLLRRVIPREATWSRVSQLVDCDPKVGRNFFFFFFQAILKQIRSPPVKSYDTPVSSSSWLLSAL